MCVWFVCSMAMETITANQRSDLDNMRQTADAEHQKCEDELRADLHKALQVGFVSDKTLFLKHP